MRPCTASTERHVQALVLPAARAPRPQRRRTLGLHASVASARPGTPPRQRAPPRPRRAPAMPGAPSRLPPRKARRVCARPPLPGRPACGRPAACAPRRRRSLLGNRRAPTAAAAPDASRAAPRGRRRPRHVCVQWTRRAGRAEGARALPRTLSRHGAGGRVLSAPQCCGEELLAVQRWRGRGRKRQRVTVRGLKRCGSTACSLRHLNDRDVNAAPQKTRDGSRDGSSPLPACHRGAWSLVCGQSMMCHPNRLG